MVMGALVAATDIEMDPPFETDPPPSSARGFSPITTGISREARDADLEAEVAQSTSDGATATLRSLGVK
ncbi:hypothetical protein EYF80_055142 [Liparis tanakae]|uniref:Uncharacterized protein n=1 Tax=Liparis tanakae TaxID=230148 RepID=A0A4Z2F1P9_9TELE|nr:hypothetical protein EYF80_055142 [Liparis tanakae]